MIVIDLLRDCHEGGESGCHVNGSFIGRLIRLRSPLATLVSCAIFSSPLQRLEHYVRRSGLTLTECFHLRALVRHRRQASLRRIVDGLMRPDRVDSSVTCFHAPAPMQQVLPRLGLANVAPQFKAVATPPGAVYRQSSSREALGDKKSECNQFFRDGNTSSSEGSLADCQSAGKYSPCLSLTLV